MPATQQDRLVGMQLSRHLDEIKDALHEPEAWAIVIYLGRHDDPQAAYIVGNIDPANFEARVGLLRMDSQKIGTVDRDGNVKLDGGN